MSNINTNGINTSYPVPGVNNNTQGFRDNFQSIKTSLDNAGNEITDLQNKAILKSGLIGVTLNNDMANTMISNALTRSFRASMYDLGSNLSGNVTIDVSRGDVQYGIVQGNTTVNFNSWMPAGTRGTVTLKLQFDANSFDYANTVITLPYTTFNSSSGNIVAGFKDTVNSIEKVVQVQTSSSTISNYLRIPAGTRELNFSVYSDDCGTTLDAVQLTSIKSANQIELGQPISTGRPGDVKGAMLTDGLNLYVCANTYPTDSTLFQFSDTRANLAIANAVIASGKFAQETDTGLFRLGNGVTHYNDVEYYYIWKGITLNTINL